MNKNFIVRNFCSGDEFSIISLWERVYIDYAGYVHRSIEYWKWCILDRPGITDQDIFLAVNNDQIWGYGVLGPNGNVLEFAVDPTLQKKPREQIAYALVKSLESRSRNRGDNAIRFTMPVSDNTIKRILGQLDYRDTPGQLYHVNIINLEVLLKSLLNHRKNQFNIHGSAIYLLKVSAKPTLTTSHGNYLIKFSTEVIINKNPSDFTYDYKVFTDIETLTKIIFNQITLKSALNQKSLTIEPENCLKEIKDLFAMMCIDCPWYVPSADLW